MDGLVAAFVPGVGPRSVEIIREELLRTPQISRQVKELWVVA